MNYFLNADEADKKSSFHPPPQEFIEPTLVQAQRFPPSAKRKSLRRKQAQPMASTVTQRLKMNGNSLEPVWNKDWKKSVMNGDSR